jgi:hypothetical protein
MTKPYLIITDWENDAPTRGLCSACPDVRFNTPAQTGKASISQRLLNEMYEKHSKLVHPRNEAGQFGAPVGRTAVAQGR